MKNTTTNTITESSHKFEMEMHNQGIEVPEGAIECIKELCDTASKRARFKAQVEFAEYGS